MQHFPDPGMTEYPKRMDRYAVISIQDTIGGGFGFELKGNQYCKSVLTLYFDDIEKEEVGLKLMDNFQAKQIIRFIMKNTDVDTLLIHYFAGVSRSRAVGAFADEFLGIPYTGSRAFNNFVYDLLKNVWSEMKGESV